MATRYNPKTVLTAGAVLWSVFTLATPSMAGNLPALLATRAAMGMGEGVAMPAISNLFAKCAPRSPPDPGTPCTAALLPVSSPLPPGPAGVLFKRAHAALLVLIQSFVPSDHLLAEAMLNA